LEKLRTVRTLDKDIAVVRLLGADGSLHLVYVNGDNTLPNLKSDEEHWKVRLTEQELMKRMFEEE
jgi:hypothetical protein